MLCQLIPSHKIAAWLIDKIDWLLESIGLSGDKTAEEIAYTCVIMAIAVIVGWGVRRVVLWGVKRIINFRQSGFGHELLKHHVLSRCSHIIPPVIFLLLIPFAFDKGSSTLTWMTRIAIAYQLIALAIAINSLLTFLWSRYNRRRNTRNLPLRGVVIVANGIVWGIVIIAVISVIIDKSPMVLFAGLGAFAAALMLIFKDSILGFVAGIQLSQNDMLRVGDWIVVPDTIANGVVEYVSLSVVKVRNWDNTIVMLPPYTLVSTSFQNWRGIMEKGVRQIVASVIIDNDSIKPITDEQGKTLGKQFPQLNPYLDMSQKQYNSGKTPINGNSDTNLGVMRIYLCSYLINHPMISNDFQILVRLLPPTANGTPLQIYCYATTTEWATYEAVQSELIEHLISICPTFDITIYNPMDAIN